jgi:inner membrane protein
MPTPIGHALAGLAVAKMSGGAHRMSNTHLAVLVFCAAAPDLDLVLRLVDGVNHHRGASHSFTAAALVGIAGYILRRLGAPLPSGWLMGAAWSSHVVLDYLGLDTSPPVGEMALWPFSSAFYASPISLFYDVPRVFTAAAMRHNALAVAIEVVMLAPIVAICWRRRPSGMS